MEGYQGVPPGGLIPFFWSPGWNSVQATAKYQSEVGGPLRGGDPGYRLIEPKKNGKPNFFSDIPNAFSPKSDQLLAVPLHHIYGSEELSAEGKAVGTLVPSAYIGLSPAVLEQLKIEAGAEVSVTVGERQYRLPCKVIGGLPEGTVGLPHGLPDLTGLALPAWIRVESGGES
jgi:NADH-quinone oxidoreductase subunit G